MTSTTRTRSRPVGRAVVATWVVLAVVAAVALVVAAGRTPDAPTEAARALELKEGTLCPVCDGQSVIESNAPVAAAIRSQIDQFVDDGLSDENIRARLAAIYGDDVNALPPSSGFGAAVWFVPVVVAVGAGAWLWLVVLRRRSAVYEAGDEADETADPALAADGVEPRRVGSLRRSTVVVVALLGLVAVGGGVALAASAGLARPGEGITGTIDRSARSLVFEAEQLVAAGDTLGARRLVDEALAVARDDRRAMLLSADLHAEAGNIIAAVADLARLVELDQNDVEALLRWAVIYVRTGDDQLFATSLDLIDRAIAAGENDLEALVAWSWVLLNSERTELIERAIAALDVAIAAGVSEFDAYLFRGVAAREIERDLELAIRMFNEALSRNPPEAMTGVLTNGIAEMEAALAE